MRACILPVAFLVAATVLTASAQGSIIRSPSAVVSAPIPTGSFTADRTIDQSGLVPNFVGGVTDFSTYIAGNPTHVRDNNPANYLASFDNTPINLDYDMGASFQILQLALWNYPFNNSAGILNFSVLTSNVSDFSSSANVGDFNAADNGNGSINNVQVFDMVDTTARYVRLRVFTTASGGTTVGLSEVAFDAVVPEPTSLTLTLTTLGLLAMCCRRRKRA